MKYDRKIARRRGFTLVETLLALGLVSILISIFLMVFVPSRTMVLDALGRQNAESVTSVLRAEMATLKPGEVAQPGARKSSANRFVTPFDKAFNWLQRSKKPETAVVVFSYRADTSKKRADGVYPALQGNRNLPGLSTQLVTVACPMDDTRYAKFIPDAVGPVYIVRMTQLVYNGKGGYRLAARPGEIVGASKPDSYVSKEGDGEPWGAAVFYRADFYLMQPKIPARYKGRSWAQLGNPSFSANLSFRR